MTARRLSVIPVAIGMILGMIAIAAPVYAEPFAVSVSEANIRSGPDSTKELLWKVEKYHPLNVVEKKGDWYHFKDFEGDEGWIHKSLVDKTPAVIAKQDNCNIRSEPNTQSQTLFKVEKGIPFKVLKREGKWIQVQHADGDTGWIHGSLVWP